ncbi:CaiB/BaiF CoA-transferase family protein [uncultured Bradyrhizobium sp.]|uniref:CaiB/BaiF CoA transferase family protein n=1 Tax=Bradyrhizobium sp. TaxID=376 RepID=UPI00261604A8|nr:CaiB/BaiF CoA-transferase family protein [uncultured Bradyrhizobium sp.]
MNDVAEVGGEADRHGPLQGLRIVELAGIGPAPMAAMLLADLGADIIRIDRLEPSRLGIAKPKQFDVLARGRPSVAVDLKHPDGLACVRDIVRCADGLIEGFRPGVMERLGLGPQDCFDVNPRLVYGRVTGWGQTGPLAQAAGHDLNYIALTGALHAIGRAGQPPTPPLNLVGDFGGGGLYLAFGVVCALIECQHSGRGQVVDAAMVDGAATLMSSIYGMFGAGLHGPERGTNLLDSGAPHYEVYRCADGEYISIAPIETKFRGELFRRLGLAETEIPDLDDVAAWPDSKRVFADIFAQRTQEEWCAVLEGADVCFAPVLSALQAPHHLHNRARGTFVEIDGVVQPAPGPRFGRSVPARPRSARECTMDATKLLEAWGVDRARTAQLRSAGIVK